MFLCCDSFKWENQAHDRAETYEIIDPYLSTKLNLVTIQLSENVSYTTTFEEDYESLIHYIKEKATNAEVNEYDAQKIGQHFLEMLPKILEWTKKGYEQ